MCISNASGAGADCGNLLWRQRNSVQLPLLPCGIRRNFDFTRVQAGAAWIPA